MPTIVVKTEIRAPKERCFDLARDVDVHCRTAAFSRERAVGGKTTGLLELGDTITFEGMHFGFRQRLTAKIVEFDRPSRFADEMIQGVFKSMRHEHDFQFRNGVTVMTDTTTWTSPFGVFGRMADLVVGPHLERFLQRRNAAFKQIAEGNLLE